MLLKNKIDKKFRLNKNFNGDQYLGFEFYKDHNSNNYRIFNADNALDALALISEQNRNDTPENLEERFSNLFNTHIDDQTKYEGVCELIAVEGRYDNPLELFEKLKSTESVTIDLERRGRKTTYEYLIKFVAWCKMSRLIRSLTSNKKN